MNIIRIEQERVKTFDEPDIDVTTTELMDLWEFVMELYEIDEAKQESSSQPFLSAHH